MQKLTFVFVAAVSLLTFSGCKKKGADESLAKMEGFANEMCACKDKACGDAVQQKMTKWQEEMAKSSAGKEAEKTDPETTKRFTDASTKMSDCFTKLAGAETPPPPAGDKPADTATAPAGTPPAGTDPAAAAPPAGDKPADTAAKPADTKTTTKPADTKTDAKKPDDKKAGGW
jgi:hypothetical protein